MVEHLVQVRLHVLVGLINVVRRGGPVADLPRTVTQSLNRRCQPPVAADHFRFDNLRIDGLEYHDIFWLEQLR